MDCNVERIGSSIRTYSTAVTGTSLDVLKAVELTVDALVKEQSLLKDFANTAYGLIEAIESCVENGEIDPDDRLNDELVRTESTLRLLFNQYNNCIVSARVDRKLNGEHEESVVREYKNTIEFINDLYDATYELKEKVMEHDVDYSEKSGSFTNSGDLLAHLDKL